MRLLDRSFQAMMESRPDTQLEQVSGEDGLEARRPLSSSARGSADSQVIADQKRLVIGRIACRLICRVLSRRCNAVDRH
jgi:hypothetical protein